MKIGLLGASFSTNNLGVNVLMKSSCQCLMESEDQPINIALVDYAKESNNIIIQSKHFTFKVEQINLRFSKNLLLSNNILFLIFLTILYRFIFFKNLKKYILRKNSTLNLLFQIDRFAAISGGDSFSDIYGYWRFLYVSLPQVLVILMGKPLVLLPQTLGPFKNLIVKKIAFFIINNSSKVYSRDFRGLRLTSNEPCIHKSIYFCPDVGFLLDPIKPHYDSLTRKIESLNRIKVIVGLNVSGLLYHAGLGGNNRFGLCINYPKLIETIIRMMINQFDATVILLPHVYGGPSVQENDLTVCRQFYNLLVNDYGDSLLFSDYQYDESEIKYIIGQTHFFIGSRMHSCIAALSQSIPSVGIAYSQKFEGVFQTIGVESLVADPRKLNESQIIHHIYSSFENRHYYANFLKHVIPLVKIRLRRLSIN